MKKCIYAAAFFLNPLLAAGCAAVKTASPDSVPPLSEQPKDQNDKQGLDRQMLEMDKRWVVANEWLAALRDVAKKTKNAHARKLFDMLAERGIIVVPTETGVWIPNGVDDRDSIRMVSLVSSDEKYGFWKKNYFGVPDAASYEPVNRMIVFRAYLPISPVFQGIIFAHEADHALNHAKNGYWPQTKRAFCEQERNTHEFQYQLTAAAGVGYKELLKTQVALMHNQTTKFGKEVGTSFPDVSDNKEALSRIFGPSYSDFEREFRNTHLWVDTVFHLIDKYFKGDKERQKAAFLCVIYDKQRIRTPQ
jgi:hypothetical protein